MIALRQHAVGLFEFILVSAYQYDACASLSQFNGYGSSNAASGAANDVTSVLHLICNILLFLFPQRPVEFIADGMAIYEYFCFVNLSVIEVVTKAHEKAFIDFPKRLYQHDPQYIMPLDIDVQKVFDPNSNPSFQSGAAVRWIIQDEHQVFGRIAAFYQTHSASNLVTGACGFFECINDQNIANSLFDLAKQWLLEKGCAYMDGPINFGERVVLRGNQSTLP